MHESVLNLFERIDSKTFAGKTILEVGSYDVNGSVRPIIERCEPKLYVGVDQTPGPRVDIAMKCELLPRVLQKFDIIVSTEMLEHVEDWRTCLLAMLQVLQPGGALIITTRSPGFPYHPYPIDVWRFTVDDAKTICDAVNISCRVSEDPQVPGIFIIATTTRSWKAPDVIPEVWANYQVATV